MSRPPPKTKFEKMSDSLAIYYASLCHRCFDAPRNEPYALCVSCYAARGPRRRPPCATCGAFSRHNVCEHCDTPNEHATYEELMDWEARHTESKGSASGLDAYAPYDAVLVDSCTICLDDVQVGESAITVRCGHTFHAKCITKWVTESAPTCPVCQLDVRPDM